MSEANDLEILHPQHIIGTGADAITVREISIGQSIEAEADIVPIIEALLHVDGIASMDGALFADALLGELKRQPALMWRLVTLVTGQSVETLSALPHGTGAEVLEWFVALNLSFFARPLASMHRARLAAALRATPSASPSSSPASSVTGTPLTH